MNKLLDYFFFQKLFFLPKKSVEFKTVSVVKVSRMKYLLITITFVILFGKSIKAGSYTLEVPPAMYFPLGWSFQAKTVANAFPTATQGTSLYFYNTSSQTYTVIVWDDIDNAWSDPNYVIQNGTGFYYLHNETFPKQITLSGTDITASSVTFNLTAGNWYFLAYAYVLPEDSETFVECINDYSHYTWRYPSYSLNYQSNQGDIIQFWDAYNSPLDGEMTACLRDDFCTGANYSPWYLPYWTSLDGNCTATPSVLASPFPQRGTGFWVKPAANNVWIQYPTLIHCGEE